MVKFRDQVTGFFYRHLLRQIFFLRDPEKVHEQMVIFGRCLGSGSVGRGLTALLFNSQDVRLEQTVAGLHFKNPVGLAAGFDKDGYLPAILPSVGFGFEEIGSVTALPFDGNEHPWMWRLPKEKALRINYGLKNVGAENIHRRLVGKKFDFVLGVSIAKTNLKQTSSPETGVADYLASYQIFRDVGDYFTINISCPNTCEPTPIFAEPENLDILLMKLFSIPKSKPVFIKLSPDLAEAQLNKILALGDKHPVDGFICSNLTKVNKFNHNGKGGFSGKAVEELANQLIAKVYGYYGGKKIVIGCGGIFNAADAYKKIKLGASLVQLITGMIFEGPQLISEINQGLGELLTADGYRNISEAVGKDLK